MAKPRKIKKPIEELVDEDLNAGDTVLFHLKPIKPEITKNPLMFVGIYYGGAKQGNYFLFGSQFPITYQESLRTGSVHVVNSSNKTLNNFNPPYVKREITSYEILRREPQETQQKQA